jgi:hypothetical protein
MKIKFQNRYDHIMKLVPVYPGKMAIVNDKHFEWISKLNLFVSQSGKQVIYRKKVNGRFTGISIAKDILKIEGKANVKYLDGDFLNLMEKNIILVESLTTGRRDKYAACRRPKVNSYVCEVVESHKKKHFTVEDEESILDCNDRRDQ